MRKTGWIAIVLLSASSIFLPFMTQSGFGAEQPGKLTPVRLGIVSRSTLDMPFYVARERKFFREEGLPASSAQDISAKTERLLLRNLRLAHSLL
jgi:ABC-type nitrate/sulfonate/bicarbonate transport system substrate-binding protein